MRCTFTASLRATATLARRMPIRAARPSPHVLSETKRIVGIGLIDLQAEGRLCMGGIEADNRQSASSRSEGQPIGELAGLQTDSCEGGGLSADDPAYGIGFRGALASPNDRAVVVDDTDRGGLK